MADFLGIRTLDHFPRSLPADARIACPIRGDPELRLISLFDKRGLSTTSLSAAIASDRVLLIGISNLSGLYLGTSESEYKALLLSVRVIAHLAWTVDFDKSLSSFQSDIQDARSLAQLVAKSKHRIALYLTTSFSSTFGCKDAKYVPERPLELNITYALDQGYAVSKIAAEHLVAQEGEKFEIHIVRIGKVSGDSSTGQWAIDEMIPMMMALLPVLGAIPMELPYLSWAPVDTCAWIMRDLIALSFTTGNTGNLKSVFVYNISNPRVLDWKATTNLFAQAAKLPPPCFVNLKDYVWIILKARGRYGDQTATYIPVVRLMTSFLGGLDGKGWLCHYALLDMFSRQKMNPSLITCLPMDSKMAGLLMS